MSKEVTERDQLDPGPKFCGAAYREMADQFRRTQPRTLGAIVSRLKQAIIRVAEQLSEQGITGLAVRISRTSDYEGVIVVGNEILNTRVPFPTEDFWSLEDLLSNLRHEIRSWVAESGGGSVRYGSELTFYVEW